MHDGGRDEGIEALTFDVKQGLRKARPFFPRGRAAQDDDTTLGLIAETVVEHLKLCRWQLHRLPPVAPHGIGTWDGESQFSSPKILLYQYVEG